MFLKVNHSNKVKKLKFSEDLQTYDKFLDTIKEITGLALSEIKMTFIDNEKEVLPINDRLDFDYFLADITESKFKEIFVEGNVESEKVTELEPVKINIEEEIKHEEEKEVHLLQSELKAEHEECIFSSISIQKVEEEPEKIETKQRVHHHVTCDVCGTRGIVGKRYKCLLCKNFDICESCESQNKHSQHPMIRCSDEVNDFLMEKVCFKFSRMSKKYEKKRYHFEKMNKIKNLINPRFLKKMFKDSVESFAKLSNPVEAKKEEETVNLIHERSVVQNEIEKLQLQKKDLLKFMYGNDQPALIEELFARFESLNIEEMVNEVMKCNAIIDQN